MFDVSRSIQKRNGSTERHGDVRIAERLFPFLEICCPPETPRPHAVVPDGMSVRRVLQGHLSSEHFVLARQKVLRR